ncbi:MAG: DUF488 domain-containing protein [Firmicutes bacterium]|nr:DUF488 domain-containing protein [Alicyclobacillaceae bacterium]MCL6496289.1 DUF488 domain-containing protein [Bacillota bacterium]
MGPVYTVGHGSQSCEAFLAGLKSAGVGTVVDVRRFPASRRHPHFSADALDAVLARAGIRYRWLRELGGRRRDEAPDPATVAGWAVAGFRHYAAYMQTPEFWAALSVLEAWAAQDPVAVLCSERLWWRCHRRLIADALVVRGWTVIHLGAGLAAPHVLTPWAVAEGGRLYYPGPTKPAPTS